MQSEPKSPGKKEAISFEGEVFNKLEIFEYALQKASLDFESFATEECVIVEADMFDDKGEVLPLSLQYDLIRPVEYGEFWITEINGEKRTLKHILGALDRLEKRIDDRTVNDEMSDNAEYIAKEKLEILKEKFIEFVKKNIPEINNRLEKHVSQKKLEEEIEEFFQDIIRKASHYIAQGDGYAEVERDLDEYFKSYEDMLVDKQIPQSSLTQKLQEYMRRKATPEGLEETMGKVVFEGARLKLENESIAMYEKQLLAKISYLTKLYGAYTDNDFGVQSQTSTHTNLAHVLVVNKIV